MLLDSSGPLVAKASSGALLFGGGPLRMRSSAAALNVVSRLEMEDLIHSH